MTFPKTLKPDFASMTPEDAAALEFDCASMTPEDVAFLEAECRQEYEEIEALLPLKYSDWASNRYEFDNTMARYIAEGRYSDEIKARIDVWIIFVGGVKKGLAANRKRHLSGGLSRLLSQMLAIEPTKILHPGYHPAVTGRPDNLSDALSQGIGIGDL